MIGRLSLIENDLDFRYLPLLTSESAPDYAEMRTLIDVSRFYSRGGHHVAFALDCDGVQGSDNPHCGPIYRDGENLFAFARGVIILNDGTVMAETWNGTFSPGLVTIANQRPEPFEPTAHHCLTVRVRCRYAGGIEMCVRKGLGGSVVFDGALPTAPWVWSGSMRACLAAIALGFVPPKDTGCVEQIEPRSAPNAKLGYAAFSRLG